MAATRPNEYERARPLIDDAVSQHIDAWASVTILRTSATMQLSVSWPKGHRG